MSNGATDLTRGFYRRLYSGATRGRRINSVSEGAEVLFWRLVMIADDLGNLHADPVLIKSDALPLRKVSPNAINRRLDELENVKLIERYQVKGEQFAHVVDWEELQPLGYDENRNRRKPIQRVPTPRDDEGLRNSTKADDGRRSGESSTSDRQPSSQRQNADFNEGLRSDTNTTNGNDGIRHQAHTHTQDHTHPPKPPQQGGGGAADSPTVQIARRVGVAKSRIAEVCRHPKASPAALVAHWHDVQGDRSVKRAGSVIAHRITSDDDATLTPEAVIDAAQSGIIERIAGEPVQDRRITSNERGVYLDSELVAEADALRRGEVTLS